MCMTYHSQSQEVNKALSKFSHKVFKNSRDFNSLCKALALEKEHFSLKWLDLCQPEKWGDRWQQWLNYGLGRMQLKPLEVRFFKKWFSFTTKTILSPNDKKTKVIKKTHEMGIQSKGPGHLTWLTNSFWGKFPVFWAMTLGNNCVASYGDCSKDSTCVLVEFRCV